jgi:POT family proton-dependent oligopeptide transporter
MASWWPFPKQIKYIVGNEACERFSFYGMRSILVIFMTTHLMTTAQHATSVYHDFVSACYFLALLGAFLSDRFLGKYKTILSLSIIYCLGHLTLAVWDNETGLYIGLALIALGSGGIKPCVSAHVGDQFNETNQHLLEKIFDIFYFSINLGSTLSTLAIPVILIKFGPGWAFGIPGILMAIATLVFWMGRDHYVHVPPTGKTGKSGFIPVFWYALTHPGDKKSGESFLDVARAKFSSEEVEGAKAAAAVFVVFSPIPIFWALFDQQGSTWVLQGEKMNREVLGFHLEASQLQALNPILVMILIPVFTYLVYPLIERLGVHVTPLRKMAAGMVMAGVSFISVGLIQAVLDSGHTISVAWQIVPYLIITCSEVMISITGLEFAYTQAPRSLKSTIMSFWLLTVSVGNFFVAIFEQVNHFSGAMFFYFFAGLTFVISVIFIILTVRYKMRNFIEHADQAAQLTPETHNTVMEPA